MPRTENKIPRGPFAGEGCGASRDDLTDRKGRVGGGERTRRGFARPKDVHDVKPEESSDERIQSKRVDGSTARLGVPGNNILSPRDASRWVADSSLVFAESGTLLVVFSRQSGGQSPARAAMDDDVLAAQLEDYRKALVGINEDVRLCAHASTRSSPARLTSPRSPSFPSRAQLAKARVEFESHKRRDERDLAAFEAQLAEELGAAEVRVRRAMERHRARER